MSYLLDIRSMDDLFMSIADQCPAGKTSSAIKGGWRHETRTPKGRRLLYMSYWALAGGDSKKSYFCLELNPEENFFTTDPKELAIIIRKELDFPIKNPI